MSEYRYRVIGTWGKVPSEVAEIERLRAVADAAEGILGILHWTPELHPKIAALGVALAALDNDKAKLG